MSSDSGGKPVSRLVSNSSAFNTLNSPPAIPIHFQKSPDFPSGSEKRGIEGLDFKVLVGGSEISHGTTAADGKVDVRVPPGGTATVQLLFNGSVVSEYEVKVDHLPLIDMSSGDAILDPGSKNQQANEIQNNAQILGTQQRLRMLGYQIGHQAPDPILSIVQTDEGTGVNGLLSKEWERSVLDFQFDQGLFADAKVGSQTKSKLTSRAGG